MDMVERVARAMANEQMAENARTGGIDLFLSWQGFAPLARAAIAAMREAAHLVTLPFPVARVEEVNGEKVVICEGGAWFPLSAISPLEEKPDAA